MAIRCKKQNKKQARFDVKVKRLKMPSNLILFFFRKKDSIYAILKMKIVSVGFKSPIHGLWVELSTTELFHLLMGGYKINVYQIQIFVFKLIVSTHVSK